MPWHQAVGFVIHALVFAAVTVFSLWMLHTSLYPSQDLVLDARRNNGWAFISLAWDPSVMEVVPEDATTNFSLGMPAFNLAILGFIYLALIVAINRFWIATWLFLTVMIVYAVADYIKVEERLEPIIPADLSFLGGGNAGKVMGFIPETDQRLVTGAVITCVVSLLLALLLNHVDCRRSVITSSAHGRLCAAVRLVIVLAMLAFGGAFVQSISTEGSWAYQWAEKADYQPIKWEVITDARLNGVPTAFLKLCDTTAMDKPDDYSQEAMEQIAEKYAAEAQTINATRSQDLTDSTVIMILSESFADSTRVPGISISPEDPLPFTHLLEHQTTSGWMLSSGYGGGTANMEYMTLTGMSLTNFSPSLTTPYQQLVPLESWTPSFNQLWSDSIGMHPYDTSMYSRRTVYRKFGFRSLRSTDNDDDMFWPQTKVENNPYVSDKAAFTGVIRELKDHDDPEFISLITMQNHAPYGPWYPDNQFTINSATTGQQIHAEWASGAGQYVKGTNITDEALQEFLTGLDNLDRPVTVIFYGDHYPGAFTTAGDDPDNAVVMHETPYFIWSNKASSSSNTKLDNANSAYTSPNYFMAQAAEHMDARVSPWLAFLTRMHEQIPAMAVGITADDDSGSDAFYLNSVGMRLSEDELTDEQRTVLEEYRLIQYDVTCGQNYLRSAGFMDLPAADSASESDAESDSAS